MEVSTDTCELVFWQNALFSKWTIEAELTKLAGEYDLNFLAKCKSGKGFILKVMRTDCPKWLVEVQIQALDHVHKKIENAPIPRSIASSKGAGFELIHDQFGNPRLVWVLEEILGQCYADTTLKTEQLAYAVGVALARLAKALRSFKKKCLYRDFKWNLMQGSWIAEKLTCIEEPNRHTSILRILQEFNEIELDLEDLEQQVIHNDANDYNILIKGTLSEKRTISGIIDFGDICIAPRICDLAIAAAYIVLDHPNPQQMLTAFVAGYHETYPLLPQEVDLIWRLLRMRLAVSLVNSTMMSKEYDEDPYITISQEPAWRFLEGPKISEALINARLRAACDMPVVSGADRIKAWLDQRRGTFAHLFGFDLKDAPFCTLSAEDSVVPRNPFEMSSSEALNIGRQYTEKHNIWLGYYGEPRLIYTDPAFLLGPWKASDRRTVHLAIDVFLPSCSPLYAPIEGVVYAAEYRPRSLDYGGVVILQHETPEKDVFYTLYGHLDPDFLDTLKKGDTVRKGDKFCKLGSQENNGGWAPHVHFQLALSTADMDSDLPGVGEPDDMYLWQRLCPNPAALLNLPEERAVYIPTNKAKVLKDREAHFGGNLSVTYDEPVMLVRGWRHHLFDEWGRTYLDAYNNVPHVGHAHPRIQAVVADQLKRINSNTRYLHPAQTEFAEKLLSKLPKTFEVCYFVNSGSEANELALRLSRSHTKSNGIVTPDHGYFGNTTGAVSISAYKFNKPNGDGKPDWVELVEVADDYRGSFKRNDPERAAKFAQFVDDGIERLIKKGFGVSGFIAETFPSVGGQIIPPKGYLAKVYEKIRAAGGVCIADEVQTGLGRLGSHYFAFEYQEVCPDIVVLGKPIGNGHPMGVVITTNAIAKSFDNGIEFFSTFGGSTLSCLIGKEVLDIVEEENLQKNAHLMGKRILEDLKQLQKRYSAIGDVRGMGLFLGVELVEADGSEATKLSSYIKNRMRDHRILLGSEGPNDNILKIRPPLTIEENDVDMLINAIDSILKEVS